MVQFFIENNFLVNKFGIDERIQYNEHDTLCPRSSYPLYIVTHFIEWVTTSWTDSI